MKLYLISQEVNDDYDTYSDAVVCAENENDAKLIRPDGKECKENIDNYDSWCALRDVKCEYIGEAKQELKRGVVCASFHAG
jgi:hypothetical protein